MKAHSGFRKYFAIFGRRNAGKSSLINQLIGREIAIVSDVPGTTTDPVYKAIEFQPIGPVTIVDTAGIDDVGELGQKRIQKAEKALYKADLALLVVAQPWSDFEEKLLNRFIELEVPYLVVLNKSDLQWQQQTEQELQARGLPMITVSALAGEQIAELRQKIIATLPQEEEVPLLADLIDQHQMIVLVTPIDLGAPKGRLIMPQVEAIRETLDRDATSVVVKERELRFALDHLAIKPALVITDSQVISRVAGDVPDEVPLTTFSILEARHKGDLLTLVKGVQAVESLQEGDRVLIMEGCSHHALPDDIGRVKIPRWLSNHTGLNLHFEVLAGKDFPDELDDVKLIVHCGGCIMTRNMMMHRIREAQRRKIPIVNYGVLISGLHGVLERVLRPFPLVHMAYTEGIEIDVL